MKRRNGLGTRADPAAPPHAGLDVTVLARGAAAGLLAAAVTSLFQAAWTRIGPRSTAAVPTGSPTEKLAVEIYGALSGNPLEGTARTVAGETIHYAMGAGLGVCYQLLERRWPSVVAGRGAAFGLGVWFTVEENGLALLQLKPPPWRTALPEHLFAISSHLVFGISLNVLGTLARGKP